MWNDRKDMYRYWGDLDPMESWKGPYPNPKTAKQRENFEIALIRRRADQAQTRAKWINYNFRLVSDSKIIPISGGNLDPIEIMHKHFEVNEAAGKAKFGTTRREAASIMKLGAVIGEEFPDDVVQAARQVSPLELAKEAYDRVNSETVYKDLVAFINSGDNGEERIREAKKLKQDLEAISDALYKIVRETGAIDESFGQGKRLKPEETIRIERASYTSAKNILEYVSRLEELADKLEKNDLDQNYFKVNNNKIALDIKKYTRGKTSEDFKETVVLRELDKIQAAITGSLSNLMGGMFETAIEETLKVALSDIFMDVQALGAQDSKATPVKGLENVSFAKSKRDIAAKTTIDVKNVLANVEVGISAKSQLSTSKRGGTKLLDTTFKLVQNVISTSEGHANLLEIAFANQSMWSSSSQMNRSIAALMADVATAGLEGDRIDYIIYRDKIVAIEDYYLEKAGKFSLAGFKPGSSKVDSAISDKKGADYFTSSLIIRGNTNLIIRAT